ncbi:hypothetical protein FOA52_014757 [Chlamydomonas sp. UWO 241]|nr:hypothetical protein FOA52_014757 [Chlamydomonas sp. UWO 241]
MLGSDYRILAKVLATRWTPLLSAVVGPEQTAFLAGRRISDNICLTQMLPGLLAANAADGVGPTGAALALLDFRKAYDTIDRGFLIAVMEAVVAGLRGLEVAVPTLWRMPLLNARKEPIWRLWPDIGWTALMWAAVEGNVEVMRLLLDHPSADATAMMMHANRNGDIALTCAALDGHVEAMRLLLDHPSADAAAMIALRGSEGECALTAAADFAAGQPVCISRPPSARSCVPLLLLLRRVAVESQPSDAQQEHMSTVMEALHGGPWSNAMFGSDQPDVARDERIRMLFERGASYPSMPSPVVSRIICEMAQLARVPQLLNEAFVGVAIARQQDQKLSEVA